MTKSQARIVRLDKWASVEEEAVGPKAFSLIRLIRLGLKVPPGFCLTVEAYRAHVDANNIRPQIAASLARLASASLAEKPSFLRGIREAITQAPLGETIRREIEAHFQELETARVAVRSSATAEDLPGRSFAGQYDTYLGITDSEECYRAVKQCWASLWSERAWEYRQKNGFDHLAVGMAVIVQSLVAADASGVLFTADPATGRADRIVIEACFGLGAPLAAGEISPDEFVVAKRRLRLVSQTTNEKKTEMVIDEQGTVRRRSVEPERMRRASIKPRTAVRLARLARKAEARLGGPQDMEWALRGREIFFLQSRPITALPAARSWEDRQVWTNANLGEVLPDAMTPMTQSFVFATSATLLDPVLILLGAEHTEREKIARLIAGRVYLNVTTWLAIAQRIPGARNFPFHELIGGAQGGPSDAGDLEISAADLANVRVSMARMILRMPWFLLSLTAHRQKRARQSLREIQAENCHLQDLDFSRMSWEELGRTFQTLVRDGLGRLDLLYVVPAMAPLAILYRLCARWLDDTDGAVTNSLLTGLGDVANAQAGIDLWRLALQARAAGAVRQALLAGDTWQHTQERLAASDEGQAFLRSWDRFMACHGHHSRGELELRNTRWSETPDYILKLVCGYVTQADALDPLAHYAEQTRRREQLQEHYRRRLKNPVRRIIFSRLLRAAQRGSVLRENFKSEAIRWTATLRRMLLELGRRLGDAGVLGTPDDVFFLQLPEVEALLPGLAAFDAARLVAIRRAQYEEDRGVIPPKVVIGRFDPGTGVPEPGGERTDVLTGVAASAGVATGPARIILRHDTDQQVRPGEILVAPFTDPGWTPYFIPAAGIVVEQGGLLSHGSIIAREYGIPAVVNVPRATQILRTGQTLWVDGNRGTVTIRR
jgi:phosphohistidine swiveling domain-containing protein